MNQSKPVFLSVIIPVYNEVKRLHNVSKFIAYLSKQKFSSELIIVNDGSQDNTKEQLKQLQQKNKFLLIDYPVNKGKGFAIKKGMLKASGKYRLFADVDLSTPIEEFSRFLPFLKNADVIIASRKTTGSKLLIRQSFIRENLGKGFTFLSKSLLGVQVSDFTCGFKCFSARASQKIFSQMRIDRWGFDAEVLFLATKYNYPIKEITVSWKNDPNSKVKFPQDLIRSLSDLITINLNNWRGRYH